MSAGGQPRVACATGVAKASAGDLKALSIDDCREAGLSPAGDRPARRPAELRAAAGTKPSKALDDGNHALADRLDRERTRISRQLVGNDPIVGSGARVIEADAIGVAGLSVSEARQIYETMYWAVAGAGLPRGLNALIFDVEVNSGRGGRTLQNAANAIFGARLTVDGAIGPATHAAVRQALLKPDGIFRLIAEVGARRDWWWDCLKINRTFGFGWNRRGSRVLVHAVRMACGDL